LLRLAKPVGRDKGSILHQAARPTCFFSFRASSLPFRQAYYGVYSRK